VRIIIVSRTRMREGRVCVGAHDLDDFRGLRLYKHDGTYLNEGDRIAIGEIWELEYRSKSNLDPPHVEDVIVAHEGASRVGREPDLSALIRRRDEIWATPDELFEGCLRITGAGSAYVPADGPLPSRSTGYWSLDMALQRQQMDGKTRYLRAAANELRRVSYVGIAAPRATIPAGTLVRVSLSRRFAPTDDHNGYWLQLSGWY
jgi:hypothetical protein